MKEVMVITDTLSSITPELEKEYDVIVVPYHLIMDGKDYLDNTTNRDELFARLKSYQNLPTHSACTAGEILNAYKKANQRAKSILFISKNRTKGKAIEALLELVKEKSEGKKLIAAIAYADNPEEAEKLKQQLFSRFEVSKVDIVPTSLVNCVVTGPGCVGLGFYTED